MQPQSLLIQYNVNVSSIAGHTFDVSLRIESPDKNGQILTLPAWIPGSYMIRDFAKNIIKISAQDDKGQTVSLLKLDKQTWQAAIVSSALTIQYQIYAFDLSVRSAFLNDEMALRTNLAKAYTGRPFPLASCHDYAHQYASPPYIWRILGSSLRRTN